nr:HEAT repeat domain-containing protein [uncultured Acetatifactor sp.]
MEFLTSSDTEVVVAALEALSRIRDEDGVNSIAAMIDNAEPRIRTEAAKALGSLGTEYAKTYLQHRMASERDETVKKAIMDALHVISSNKK